jgi:hypothetical protein
LVSPFSAIFLAVFMECSCTCKAVVEINSGQSLEVSGDEYAWHAMTIQDIPAASIC